MAAAGVPASRRNGADLGGQGDSSPTVPEPTPNPEPTAAAVGAIAYLSSDLGVKAVLLCVLVVVGVFV
jgi:hypothetical protein